MTTTQLNVSGMLGTQTTLQNMVIKKLQSNQSTLSDDKKKFRRLTRSIDFPKTMPTEEDAHSISKLQYFDRRNLGTGVTLVG